MQFDKPPESDHKALISYSLFLHVLLQGPPQQGPIKFTIADTLERIKEEFNFLQQQYHQ